MDGGDNCLRRRTTNGCVCDSQNRDKRSAHVRVYRTSSTRWTGRFALGHGRLGIGDRAEFDGTRFVSDGSLGGIAITDLCFARSLPLVQRLARSGTLFVIRHNFDIDRSMLHAYVGIGSRRGIEASWQGQRTLSHFSCKHLHQEIGVPA